MLVPGHTVAVKLRREGEPKEVSIAVEAAPPAVMSERRAAAVGRMLQPSREPMRDTLERRMIEAQTPRAAAGPQATRVMTGARAGGGGGMVTTRMPSEVALMASRGYLGARMTDIEPTAYAELTEQKPAAGVLVTSVPPGTPAARMGLRGGDLIVAVADVPVASLMQLSFELASRGPDRVTSFSVLRKGKVEKLTYEPR
jgi:hypothetical protein